MFEQGQFDFQKCRALDDFSPIVGPLLNSEDMTIYVGQFKKGLRHGWGKMLTYEGTIFEGKVKTHEGDFFEDQITGFGRIIHSSGDLYVGEWFEGDCHGKGSYFGFDGSTYSGSWQCNKQHGYLLGLT